MTTSLWARALSALPDKDQRMFGTLGAASPPVSQTLGDIIAAIETQRDRCKRHKWSTISIGGKELVIRDVCAKIVSCVNRFACVVDVVVSFDPVHAALPWAGVRFVLQLFLKGMETFDVIVEGMEMSVRVIARGGILEGLYYQKNSTLSEARQALLDDIVKCYTAVLKFLSLARRYYQCSRLKRAVDFISKDDLRDCIKEIQDTEQQFLIQKGFVDSEELNTIGTNILHTTLISMSTAGQVSDMQASLQKALVDLDKPLARVVDQVSDLHQALKDSERDQILRWISPVPVQEHYREALASLMPNSGEWLFHHSEFQSWRDSSSSEVLWLHGAPGCGKSKIAAAVIQRLRLQASKALHPLPIIHFFCSRNPAEPERSDAREILRSLVKQLSLSDSKDLMRTPVVEEYRERLREAHHYGEGPATLSIEECTELIYELGRSAPVMIIIDALDECDPKQRLIIQQALEEMCQTCRDLVKIFVSSRYEEDIATGFRSQRSLGVTPEYTENDLKHFVHLHVQRFISRWATLHGETNEKLQQLEKELSERLIVGAQGMFLWVSLQLECISDTSQFKDLESIDEALKVMPATLGRRDLQGAQQNCNLGPSLTIAVAWWYLESLEAYRVEEVCYGIAMGCLEAYLAEDCDDDEFFRYATKYWPSHVEDLKSAPQRANAVPHLRNFFTKEEHFEDWLDSLELQPREGGSRWNSVNQRKLDASISTPRTPLFVICCYGLVEMLEYDEIIEELDVNQTNQDGSSGLYLAARGGHSMVVQRLLDMGANIDAPGHQYGNALQAACSGGWIEIVRLLLNHGASSSMASRGEYSSPLQAALASGHDTIAKIILDAGIKLTTQQQFDDVIKSAAFKGNIAVLQRILAGEAGDFFPDVRPDPLQVALAAGKMRRAKQLLQGCPDINEEKGFFGTALTAAIASERLSIVQVVLDAGAKLELRGRYGFPLRAAVITNNIEITKYLLEEGADPNSEDMELGDALQAAASRGSLELMSLLLSYKADVQGRGGHFGDTLQAAAFGGHEKAIELLIRHGALDSLEEPRGRYHNALKAAVYAGHQSIVQMLLGAGVNLRSDAVRMCYKHRMWPASFGRKMLPDIKEEMEGLDCQSELGPLEIAAQQGNVALLDMLLVKGDQVGPYKAYSGLLESSHGSYTALQVTAFWGHTPAVRCLLAHGVDINAVRPKIGTALQAALEGEQYHIAELLIDHGADIDRHWTVFGSCLQVFSERGKLEAVQFLLDRGATINDAGGKNGNALQVACGAGHVEVVQLLLQKGADVNAQGKAIGTALYAACAYGKLRIVELLLRHGAIQCSSESDFRDSLEVASANGSLDIVERLLDHDAKVGHNESVVDLNINIALQAACANGCLGIVGILLDRGASVHDTMLCMAAKTGDTSLIRLLLQRGARVNPQTKQFQPTDLEENAPIDDSYPDTSPLHFAAYNGHEAAVSCLLNSGANLHDLHPLLQTRMGRNYRDIEFERSKSNPLQAACYKGYAHIAKRLFAQDPWGYIEHKTFTRALQITLEYSQHETQRILLSEAIHAGFKAEQFSEILVRACSKGYKNFLAQLLEHFTVINWPDGILEAAEHGRAGTVDILVSHGADASSRNKSGESAIDLVIDQMKTHADYEVDDIFGFDAYHGFEEDAPDYMGTLAILINAGQTLDNPSSASIPHLVRCTVRAGRLDILTALESSGISIFKEPGSYSEALVLASTRNRAEVLRYLLSIRTTIRSETLSVQPIESKAEEQLSLSRSPSRTFLSESEEFESVFDFTGVISALSQHDAQVAHLIKEPFNEAMRHKHVECIRVFIDLLTKDDIHRAAVCTHLLSLALPSVKMLSFLLSQGANPNTRNAETGETLLHLAAARGDEDALGSLLSYGSQISLQSGMQGTALHAAVVQGFYGVSKLLLESAADVEAPSPLLGTPLAAVMARKWKTFGDICHRSCAELLLDWGADIDSFDERLGTPIDIAYKAGNKEGVELLLERGALDFENHG
ncbi:hypothetical protein AbraCBS73388_005553 [Aspergillus brasiliensis]|uniref:NWD NACHT-NTPase N-terminal domain-containing protein n=1 Tax=Aspergillus brasiliensis TaxID=319629 RepID=A0A9W6DKV1_9EURO|nr:hypothetical protein AbraCBS73388_005553 [Aspergillus brasiliensis]